MKHTTVQDIYQCLDAFYPFHTQMSFDNAGFLVGDGTHFVTHVLVALDITTAVIEEAINKKCQLIITHHPIIFAPLKSLVASNPTERMILMLAKHEIAVISAHTNLDQALDGVNYHLAKRLGLQEGTFVVEEGVNCHGAPYGLGWHGHVTPTSATEFTSFVAKELNASGVRLCDVGRTVAKVAVGGGACGSMLDAVSRCGCDTFVTGDVKYDVFLDAKERNINLIDAGHFPTEQVICTPLAKKLQDSFSDLCIVTSEIHNEVSRGFF